MPWSFWEAYAAKLTILGLVLAGLYALGRTLRRMKPFGGRRPARYVDVIESTMLSQHVAVHLIRVGARYVLIGGGSTGLFKLAEFTARELEAIPQNT